MSEFRLRRAFIRVGGKGQAAVASGLSYATGVAKNIAGIVASKAKSAVSAGLNYTSFQVPPPLGVLDTISFVTSTGSGILPYTAGFYPLEGAVPSGNTVVSPDDATMQCSVLSTWTDGSVKSAVVCGQKTFTPDTPVTVRVQAGAAPGGAALTTSAISALVTGITVNCNTAGSVTLSNFSSPHRTWWANPQTICAQYNQTINGSLQAVVYIHAFSGGRAKVEIVVENSGMNSGEAAPLPDITIQTYGTCIVTINGVVQPTVTLPTVGQAYHRFSGAGGGGTWPVAGHEDMRAFYVSYWIGGDPAIDVYHTPTAMQAHPLFWKMARAAATTYQTEYSADAYVPWSVGRLNVPNMGGTGDAEPIGPLTKWDARHLQAGSRYTSRAVVNSALAALTLNVNLRDASGDVPTIGSSLGKYNTSNQSDAARWPNNAASEPSWELAHHPAVGVMAFMVRPSPVFIELLQKIALWNRTSQTDNAFGYWAQVRGKAWGMRTLAHATFITPDSHPWKATARDSINLNVDVLQGFVDSANGTLQFIWSAIPTRCADMSTTPPSGGAPGSIGMQHSIWENYFLLTSLHMGSRLRLVSGADQTQFDAVADWVSAGVLRYVNDPPVGNGSWRLHNYLTYVGARSGGPSFEGGDNLGSGIYALDSWNTQPTHWQNFANYYTDSPPGEAGTFLFINHAPTNEVGWPKWANASGATTADAGYASQFWGALCIAVERNLAGSALAWARVQAGVTNLATWLNGFITDPRWGRDPRSGVAPAWVYAAPFATYKQIPVVQTIAQATPAAAGQAFSIGRSYSANITWNDAYGPGGGGLFTGGGHAANNCAFAWVFDGAGFAGGNPGWRDLNTTIPSGVSYANVNGSPNFKWDDGSEVSCVQASMPVDATEFHNYPTNSYWWKPRVVMPLWSGGSNYPFSTFIAYGELAHGVPMGFHSYNTIFALKPGQLGMGAKGGWGFIVKPSVTINSGLGVRWGNKIDADTGAWSRMPYDIPLQGTGGATLYNNYGGTWTKSYTDGNYAYNVGGESANGFIKTDLTTGAHTVIKATNPCAAIGGMTTIPGSGIAFMLGSADRNTNQGHFAQVSVQGIDLNTGQAHTWTTLSIVSNTLPTVDHWEEWGAGVGAAALMWVPEVGKFAIFGTSPPSTPQFGFFPFKIFWLTPPANLANWLQLNAWSMEEEALTAGDAVAADPNNRFYSGSNQFQGCWWSSKLRCFVHFARPDANYCFFFRTAKVP
jgi:hypothetical protein